MQISRGLVSKENILVIDDNQHLADFIANSLLKSLGYEAQTAYTGKIAFEIIRSISPDLILLDMELPDINGLEFLNKLQEEGHNIPTILMTAHGSEQIAVDAFRLGVEDYLIKPVDADKLRATITYALTETRLREETTRLTNQLKDQVARLNILSKIGRIVTSTLNLDQLLKRIVEACVQITQAEEGFLALLDTESGQLYLRAAKNIDEDQIKTLRIPLDDSLIGKVIQTGNPLRKSVDTGDLPVKVSTGYLVQSLLHVPIISKGNPIGVLSVDNRNSKQKFTKKDELMLSSLADYASVALENARLYQKATHEISERKKMAEELRESEERYALAVLGANDGLWDWNLKTNKIYLSPRWKSMLGYVEDEIKNEPNEWFNRIHPQDLEKVKLDLSAHIRGLTTHFENEHRVLHKDGSYRWLLSRGIAVKGEDGVVNRIAGSQSDISDRKAAEAKLLHDAFFDRLTGLPNRSLFMDRLKNAIERSKRRKDYIFAVLFLDLDQFKNVNDTLGHPVGDQLLIAIANILKSNLRTTDTVARLGGDEFVILLEDIEDTVAAVSISEWILRKLASPIRLVENEVFISASIGIVLSTLGYSLPEDILRDADIAMYAAKARGKATFELFNPTMRERILKRVSLESDLRRAVESEQLLIFYQPIVSLKNGQLVGLEALARWQHPERGLITPSEFITLARETGLIIPIDQWVLEKACSQIQKWQDQFQFDPKLKININVTSNMIAQPDFVEIIKATIKETKLEFNNLRLEITESTVMANSETITDIIKSLNEIGVEVQIDDFGTGHSSLMYLQKFHLDALKIDKLFIQQMSEQGNNTEIVRTIVELAHELNMEACAEGIETKHQLAKLRSMNCDCGQGFLFSIPLDAKAVSAMLENKEPDEKVFAPWRDLISESS